MDFVVWIIFCWFTVPYYFRKVIVYQVVGDNFAYRIYLIRGLCDEMPEKAVYLQETFRQFDTGMSQFTP